MAGLIQKTTEGNAPANKTKNNINTLLNSIIDSNGMRRRFEELLGKRTPQFLSSIVTLINADDGLKRALQESPMTVIQSALKAATFDLPIEPSLGYAYIVAFKNNKKLPDGSWAKVYEATFIPGYKGLEQLCLRTGAYARVPDAVDVREGELLSYDRLTGDCEFRWVEDEDEREKLPIVGYAGYFRLKNGAEKTIYMTVKQIQAHELKNRKGDKMGKGWREDFDAMARKTVIRRLAGKYGLMSIEYRDGDKDTVNLANALMQGDGPESDSAPVSAMEVDYTVNDAEDAPEVDETTGEVKD